MTIVQTALAYAQRGWLVVPLHNPKQGKCSCRKKNCGSPGKHPRTEHGLNDGSRDSKQIARRWEKWPDANLGILTGQNSDLVVLDVDGNSAALTPTEYYWSLNCRLNFTKSGICVLDFIRPKDSLFVRPSVETE